MNQFNPWRNLAELPVLFRFGRDGFAGLARRWLERAMRDGGVWHLWGHSWETERFGLWAELEAVFAMIAKTRGRARWLTNGQLFVACAAAHEE